MSYFPPGEGILLYIWVYWGWGENVSLTVALVTHQYMHMYRMSVGAVQQERMKKGFLKEKWASSHFKNSRIFLLSVEDWLPTLVAAPRFFGIELLMLSLYPHFHTGAYLQKTMLASNGRINCLPTRKITFLWSRVKDLHGTTGWRELEKCAWPCPKKRSKQRSLTRHFLPVHVILPWQESPRICRSQPGLLPQQWPEWSMRRGERSLLKRKLLMKDGSQVLSFPCTEADCSSWARLQDLPLNFIMYLINF